MATYSPPEVSGLFNTSTETHSERATLTFLSGGGFVLGCPRDADQREVQAATDTVKRGMMSGRSIVLPWPVDVTDLRAGG